MFIITTKVGNHTYYFQLLAGEAILSGLKDNAVVYPSWAHAAADVVIYKNKFETELTPIPHGD